MSIKVAIIQPHSKGGICHYTYELSRSLKSAGVEISLFTNDDYELENYPQDFSVFSLTSSKVKSSINSLFNKQKKSSCLPGELATEKHSEITTSQNHNSGSSSRYTNRLYQQARTLYLQCENIVRIRLYGIRIIHLQWLWPSKSPALFIRLAKVMGLKIIYTAHNILPHDNETNATKRLHTKCYKLVDNIIVHSRDNFKELQDLFSVPQDKITIIPHGNYGFFSKTNNLTSHNPREQFKIDRNKKVILFFGSIQKYKGLDILLPAFKEAYKYRRDLYLLIAGKLRIYDNKDTHYFEEIINKLGIQDAVRFSPNYVPMDKVSVHFEAADIIIMPYLKTYQSGIVQLAYAFGKPVIATRTGGLTEVVKHQESGILVPLDSQTELTKAILEIFKSPEACKKMGETALKLSKSEYSWTSISQKTIALYKKIGA